MALQIGDTGTDLILTVVDERGRAVDLSTATTLQIILSAPDGTVSTKTASYVSDGSDGKLVYTTLSTDLDQSGNWQIQAYVVVGTSHWHTAVNEFTVAANLDD